MGEQPSIKSEKPDDIYASYMKEMNGPPLDAKALEFVFDCADKNVVLEYRNFDPKKLMMSLIERASQLKTPPAQFQEEMNNLVTFKRELARFLSGQNSFVSDLERHPPKWFQTLKELEKKYDVKPQGMESNVITHVRLGFMFPHYYIQAVLKMPLYACLYLTPSKIPEVFAYPELACLIPDAGNLKDSVRKGIIFVYIFRQRQCKPLSLRTLFMLLKRRIETSQLSNDRRVRFLQTVSVIKLNGELAPKTEEALQYVKEQDKKRDDKIEDDMLWNILD